MRASIIERALLCIISDRAVNQLIAILAFLRAIQVDWTAHDCLDWFPYSPANTTIICVPIWPPISFKRGLC